MGGSTVGGPAWQQWQTWLEVRDGPSKLANEGWMDSDDVGGNLKHYKVGCSACFEGL